MQIQKQVLKQEQKLKMTPQLYQAIKMMALPIQDLRLCIREEIEKNPALEMMGDKALESFDEVSSRSSDDYDIFDVTLRSMAFSNKWELALSARNLFNKRAFEPSQSSAFGPAIPGDLPLARRSVWGELRFKY